MPEEGGYFLAREYDTEARRAFRPDEIRQPVQVAAGYVSVPEEQRGESLVLGRGGHIASGREIARQLGNLRFAYPFGVPGSVAEEEPTDPGQVSFFGARAVVTRPEGKPQAVCGRGPFGVCCV